MAFDTNSQAKTLADMTAEERKECVGMWADTPGNELAVIASVSEPDVSRVFFPQSRGDGAALLNMFITPRFDLPRAWTPDGEALEKNGTRDLVYRLQSAVWEMLYELNIYQQQENEQRIRKEPLDTLETYRLTKEDME